jgi:hypothetical protein
LTLGACASVIEIQIPDSRIPVTVNAVFSPDSLMKVELYRAVNFYDTIRPFLPVENAGITVTSGAGKKFELHWDNGYYMANDFPEYGESYEISVTIPGYSGTVTAVTRIPERKPDFRIVQYGIDSSTFSFINVLFVDIELNDPPGVKNIYTISAEEEALVYTIDPDSPDHEPILTDTLIQQGYVFIEPPPGNHDLAGDKLFDLNEKVLIDPHEGFRIRLSAWEPSEDKPRYLSFRIIIREINEDYYSYLTTAYINQDHYGDIISGPSRVYSNIVNGTGIFAAVAGSRIQADHPQKNSLKRTPANR